jgi:osmotically-inducible protein OsmY
MRKFLRMIPITRATAALWAWRNRREVGRWLGFAWRALPPAGNEREDLVTEARLRAALSKDERTRGLPTLSVRVDRGIATLDGRLAPQLHDLVSSIAESTKGVRSIRCRIGDRSALGPPRPHVHASHISTPGPR